MKRSIAKNLLAIFILIESFVGVYTCRAEQPVVTAHGFGTSNPALVCELNKPGNIAAIYNWLKKEEALDRKHQTIWSRVARTWSNLKRRCSKISSLASGFTQNVGWGAVYGAGLSCVPYIPSYYFLGGSVIPHLSVLVGGALAGAVYKGGYFCCYHNQYLFNQARDIRNSLSLVVSNFPDIDNIVEYGAWHTWWTAYLDYRKEARKATKILVGLASNPDKNFRDECVELWNSLVEQEKKIGEFISKLREYEGFYKKLPESEQRK
ncbi:MAG: hypothetical protein WCW33_03250 [Candidatus Babeliales bacterium]|jgi:hypothetical protein